MMRTLVLFNKVEQYYFKHLEIQNVDVSGLFKELGLLANVVMKISKKLRLPTTVLFYGKWYKQLKHYDKIVVFDIAFLTDHALLSNIARKSKTNKLFFYSWNIVNNLKTYELEKKEVEKNRFKFYHYDHKCCRDYNLNFNTIMYDSTLQIEKKAAEYDALFLGFLKDRKETVVWIF